MSGQPEEDKDDRKLPAVEKSQVPAVIQWNCDEQHTPRRFQSMDPDVTVKVGGVEFYHYKSILCSHAFFDKMLSSQMKESETNAIEFPDGAPEDWLEVYKFLDPYNGYITMHQSVSSLLTKENVDVLIPWFDYFGMDQHLALCDGILHKRIMKDRITNPPSYEYWEHYKLLGAVYPKTIQAIITATKHSAHNLVRNATTSKKDDFEEFTKFLLDDNCGDEIWSYFISTVVNLPPGMLDGLDRETIVPSPLFRYTVGVNPRPVPVGAKPCFFDDSDSDSDDSSWYAPKRKAPAPAPRPRRRQLDTDSSEEESSDEESSSTPIKRKAPSPLLGGPAL